MSKTDGERMFLREQMLERLYEYANYGDKKILTFDPKRYGNLIVQFGDNKPESIPLDCLAEELADDDNLREVFLEACENARAKL